jgi:MoxR-like ATPase
MDDRKTLERIARARKTILEQVSRSIIGQRDVLDALLVALLARGHVLLVGVPGLAKTLMIRSLAQALDLSFNRIQFTPDLMPSDITGTDILEEDRASGHKEFRFIRGPLFAQVVLADEINRTPPKTQAALLQAMAEQQVSAAGQTFPLDPPFFVLATQNPIEQEGTYPLPEAQLDRFMLNLKVEYPSIEEEIDIVASTTSGSAVQIDPVLTASEIIELQDLVRRVPVADSVLGHAVALARATRPDDNSTTDRLSQWIRWGAGPRASQYLVLGAKARAVLQGRPSPGVDDVRAVAKPVLRHRIVRTFRAEADGIDSDRVVDEILEAVQP